jgi:hypothetical protein
LGTLAWNRRSRALLSSVTFSALTTKHLTFRHLHLRVRVSLVTRDYFGILVSKVPPTFCSERWEWNRLLAGEANERSNRNSLGRSDGAEIIKVTHQHWWYRLWNCLCVCGSVYVCDCVAFRKRDKLCLEIGLDTAYGWQCVSPWLCQRSCSLIHPC